MFRPSVSLSHVIYHSRRSAGIPFWVPQGYLRGPGRGPGPDPGRWSDSEKIDFFNMSQNDVKRCSDRLFRSQMPFTSLGAQCTSPVECAFPIAGMEGYRVNPHSFLRPRFALRALHASTGVLLVVRKFGSSSLPWDLRQSE